MTKNSIETLLFVTCGKWQSAAILEAKKMGVRCIGIDTNPLAAGRALCDGFISVDALSNLDIILAAINENNYQPDGALSYCSDAGQRLAFKLRDLYNLHGLPSHAVEKSLRKDLQRQAWGQEFDPHFRWHATENPEEGYVFAERLNSAFVIKPCDSSGSRGVTILDAFTDKLFEEAFNLASKISKNGIVVIEEFVEGDEFTIDAFGNGEKQQILLVTKKSKLLGRARVVAEELITVDPKTILFQKIEESTISALTELGLIEGPSHTEIIFKLDGSIHFIETSGRGGGFNLASKVLPMATGINFARLCVEYALGKKIESHQLIPSYYRPTILKFIPSRPGRIIKIPKISSEILSPDLHVESFAQLGDVLQQPTTDGDRLGCVIASGFTMLQAKARVELGEKQLIYELK